MSVDGAVIGPVPEGQDPEAYDRLRRRVLWSLPTGLFVIGSRAEGRRNLMTATCITQLAVIRLRRPPARLPITNSPVGRDQSTRRRSRS